MKVSGQCHCGDIAYEAEIEPTRAAICHCRDCQRLSGSAFRANVFAPSESFRLLRGEPRQYIKTGDSGAKRVHAFCGHCGSPIYSSAIEKPRTYTLRIGGLDQRAEVGRPSSQIWVTRRLPWVPVFEGVPEVDEQPQRTAGPGE
jgi:hypothetical protein